MFKRLLSVFVSLSAGLFALAAVLALAQHPAGVAWAAPETRPLAATLTVGFGCGSIQACIDAASPGDEVHIPAGLYTESLTVAKDISITGDLSSTTIIHALDNQRVMSITGASVYMAQVMLTGGVISSGVMFSPDVLNSGGGLYIEESQVALVDVAIKANTAHYSGGGLYALTSTVTLTGAEISGNSASTGGGVFIQDSQAALLDVIVQANTAYDGGGLDNVGSLSVTDSLIISNTATNSGAGIDNRRVLTITDSILSGNTVSPAGGSGGGIFMYDISQVTIVSSTLSNNSSSSGGGLANYAGYVDISNTQFLSNTATVKGGGIATHSCFCIFTTITHSTFDGNSAPIGAGLYNDASMTVTDSLLTNNHASSQGGAIDNFAHHVLFISNTTILSNTAQNGGGIWSGTPLQLTDSTLMSNTASALGGGIYTSDLLTITNSTLVSNTAATLGGALYVYTGTIVTIDNSQLIGNAATDFYGTGGIYSAGALTVTDSAILNTIGIGLQNNHGQVTFASGFISNNSSLGLLNYAGSAVITGSTIANNPAGGVGNQGLNNGLGDLTVINSLFSGNSNPNGQVGGGAIGNIDGSLAISGSTFVSNSAFGAGGGIFSYHGAGTTVWDSTFDDNQNGAIFNLGAGSLTSTLSINGSVFSKNQASDVNAGITNETDRLIISGTTFVSNTSSSIVYPGGAVYNFSESLCITGSTFYSNSTTAGGGALSNDSSPATITNSIFSGNHSLRDGGALQTSGSTTVLSSTFSGNQSSSNGGAIFTVAPLTLTNSTLLSNTAATEGGALYVYTGTVATLDNTQFISNTSTASGGTGGIYSAGTLTMMGGALLDTFGVSLRNNHGQALVDSVLISNSQSFGLLNDTGTMVITGSTITRNPGGGARNNLSSGANGMTVISSLFSENSDNPAAINGAGGGAIANYGSQLTITNSSFISNSATSLPDAQGGAIWSDLATGMTISHSTFTSNTQSAIFNEGSGSPTVTVLIANSVFRNNQSQSDGAAINNTADNLAIFGTTFANNQAAGIDGGGAIFNRSQSLGITASAFYSNTTAVGAGAIQNEVGAVTIANSTFSGNFSFGNVGAIWLVSGPATINNVTVANNTAFPSLSAPASGGLGISSGTVVTVSNSVLAGNTDSFGQAPDCAGTLTTGGHNLIQSTAGCTLSGTASGDITGTAALLGPLQDNGGPTLTQALLAGSPAVDAGSPAAPGSGGQACEAADQRGTARPQGLACDIGAYEAVGLSLTATVQLASSAYGAAHSAGSVPITVTLSHVLPVSVTAQYSTTDGSALAGQDYLAASGTLTFTPGLTQTSFAVALLPVAPGGPDRDFSVAILSPTVATLGAPATATVTLHNDEPLPAVAFSRSQYTVTEGGGSALITATLSTASQLTATVQYTTSDGAALAGQDYTAASGTLTFTPGLTQTTFLVPITPDALHEADENFSVAVGGPISASLGVPNTATVTILDDDPAPTISLSSGAYAVTESQGSATVTVTLSAASALTTTVHYGTSDGTALAGSDYATASGTLTFTPGLTQTTFSVPITADALHEADETFGLGLTSPANASLGAPNTATVTIQDDDPAPTVSLSSAAYAVGESQGTASFTATLSAASGLTATVHFATSDGAALAGSDYAAASGTLTFTPGLTLTTFSVSITSDALHEANEAFGLSLTSPANASLGVPNTAAVTILDDDPLPSVRFSSAAYTVSESGGSATITVTLSAASGLTATVHFASSNGSASAGSDYTPVSGTLTFAPGQVQQVFTVPITNDIQVEGSETLQLTLTSPAQASLGSPSAASLTILDDDVEFKQYLPLVDR